MLTIHQMQDQTFQITKLNLVQRVYSQYVFFMPITTICVQQRGLILLQSKVIHIQYTIKC